ncbi:MAG: hypothetical protein RJA61_487 [Candidatus Parcubacteria bacterium]|jgi:UDP-glucose 4-epimerase
MNSNKKQKVIVVGGMGFIGTHVSEELVRKGFDVHIVDNLSGDRVYGKVPKLAKLHKVSIQDSKALIPIFKGASFVFHLAAKPRVQYSIEYPFETHENNITGTLNVLIASHQANVKKVIYSASSSAYGDQKILPLVEDMIAHPKSPYGLQKYVGELYCRLWSEVYGLPTVSLRYFNVYGPGQSEEGAYALVIAKFLKQRREGKPLTIVGDGKQTRDFTHVRDVVRANILAMESDKVGKGEVINIGRGKNVSISEVAKLIKGPISYIPSRLEPHDTRAGNKKAFKLIGWKPQVDLKEGILELKKINDIV